MHVRWKTSLGLVGGAALVLLAASLWSRGPEAPTSAAREPVATAPVGSPPEAASAPSPGAALPGPVTSSGQEPFEKLLQVPAPEPAEEPRREYPVNLERLRERLPDNLYWQVGAPTKDPQVLQKRAEEERGRNELFGKVQAGEASEEEIHRYYDFRRQLSEDYLEFAGLMLSEYGEQLPERDRGLLELSIQMHRGRLAELPRQREEALARKLAQDQRREEWRRGGKGP